MDYRYQTDVNNSQEGLSGTKNLIYLLIFE